MTYIKTLLLGLALLFHYPTLAQDSNNLQNIEQAAEAGDVAAQFQLANLYLSGALGHSDPDKALVWYRRSAEGGYADANIRLAELYIQGLGGTQDFDEAIKWLQKPATQGVASAQTALGWALIMGKQDYQAAVAWFEAAAEHEHAEAVTALGSMYYDGTGVERDLQKSQQLYKKACDLGSQSGCIYYEQRKN
ncbi:MAG: tetratricopeptide repeat protein [Alcaligenaceae bacterium]|nr:tetratricopeptide repeat protein [Alcaligenaceae bacterium]